VLYSHTEITKIKHRNTVGIHVGHNRTSHQPVCVLRYWSPVCGRVVSNPASYLGGPGFKSRPETGYSEVFL
jgi:hypothetical protein